MSSLYLFISVSSHCLVVERFAEEKSQQFIEKNSLDNLFWKPKANRFKPGDVESGVLTTFLFSNIFVVVWCRVFYFVYLRA